MLLNYFVSLSCKFWQSPLPFCHVSAWQPVICSGCHFVADGLSPIQQAMGVVCGAYTPTHYILLYNSKYTALEYPPPTTFYFTIANRLFSTALVVFTEPYYLCWIGLKGYATDGIRLTERGVYATIMGGVGSYEG